jgi:hypothetical protein
MAQATFGVFDWIDRGNTPLQPLFVERLQLLEVADSAGFFAYHDAEALAATRAAHTHWYRSITKLWHEHDDHLPDSLFSWETSTQQETILFGAPARVREQLAQLLEVSGCNYVICAFAWGTLPHEQTLRSLRLFTEEVMPAFFGSTALTA